ncbi:MAG: hypothetical protein KGJ70_02680 [Gemmatimonadota bacterium]|nr:hypothetical protein [Gemmatimonadota bacterium]
MGGFGRRWAWRWVPALALLLPPTSAGGQAPRDSARIDRAMHDAQRDFEWHRRMNLSWTSGGSGGACDARIGRFCYWHGTTPDSAPPEPATIVRARDELIARLDSAGGRLPGDGWIAGQRVRYLLEAGRTDDALLAARACRAALWWCDALQGLVLHVTLRFAAAESTYDRALDAMPDRTRCRWTDLSTLLDGAAADRYRQLGCAERGPFDRRLWWLAQPFYSLGANDRRTEHFARRTMVEIARQSVWPVAGSWGDDLRDLIVRYGWPRWYERVRPDISADPNFSVMGHDPQPSFAFFPDGRLLDSAYDARPSDWNLRANRAPSRYAPAYLEAVEPVSVLLSRFRRGDSMTVVAAYEAERDSILGGHRVRAALVVMPDERQAFADTAANAPAAGALMVTAPALPALASVELLDRTARAGARERQAIAGLPPAPGMALSDVLLFRPGPELPATLGQAAGSAIASVGRAAGPVGLYWELYAAAGTRTTVDVSLTVERTESGWWSRARRFLRLGARGAPIALRWRDAVRFVNGVAPRAVSVDLSRLGSGRYTLRLEVSAPGVPTAVDERVLDLAR